MTRPPPYPAPGAPIADDEQLDELGDDAIVAQQAVHQPQRRVQVEMESRTIVVAEEDPFAVDPSEVMETRQLPQYSSSSDPTPIARRASYRAPTLVLRRVPLATPQKVTKRNWIVIGIWIVAGVVAFGFGGVLAALTARGGDKTASHRSAEAPAATLQPLPPSTPAPPAAVTPEQSPTKAVEPIAQPTENTTAVQVPTEKSARPRIRRATSGSASTAPPAVTATTPVKSDIPEGI